MNHSRPLPRWAWIALLLVYLLGALVYSIVQPLGHGPDEVGHANYIQAIAESHRLPAWDPRTGGEAGYETQHPPLYYVVMALFYAATGFLAENWRWQVLRWISLLLIGIPLFFVCRRFFSDLLSPREPCPSADGDDVHGCVVDEAPPALPLILTASVLLMPLTALHTGTVNPQIAALLLVTLTLWLSWRLRECPFNHRQSLLVGVLAGLATLTRLAAAPVLVVALLAHLRPRRTVEQGARVAWVDLGLTLVGFLATAGWWFWRNWWLYRDLLPHTRGPMGSGLRAAFSSSLWDFAWLTWRETFLGSFARRGLFPGDFWTYALYGVVLLVSVLAVLGLIWGRRTRVALDEPEAAERLQLGLNFSGVVLLLVFLAQQWAYWAIDVQLNAGGSYILIAMAPLVLLLTLGLVKLLRHRALTVLWAWLLVLIIMNVVSMWSILNVLNPRFAPGWHPFQLP